MGHIVKAGHQDFTKVLSHLELQDISPTVPVFLFLAKTWDFISVECDHRIGDQFITKIHLLVC